MTDWIAQGPYIKEHDDRGATVATVHTGNASDAKQIAALPALIRALVDIRDSSAYDIAAKARASQALEKAGIFAPAIS
jgi:hypothetical protein